MYRVNRRRSRRRHDDGSGLLAANLAGLHKLTYYINTLEVIGPRISCDALERAIGFLHADQQKQMVGEMIKAAVDHQVEEAVELRTEYENGCESAAAAIIRLLPYAYIKRRFFNTIVSALQALLREFEAKSQNRPEPDGNCDMRTRLDEIRRLFTLNDDDIEIVLLLFLCATDQTTDILMDLVIDHYDIRRGSTTQGRSSRPIAVLTGLRQSKVSQAISCNSNLIRSGLVDEDRTLVDEVVDYLEGISDVPLTSKYFRETKGDVLPLEYHMLKESHIQSLKKLYTHKDPEKGVNILLYGVPGSGKTETARSLAAYFKVPVYEIRTLAEQRDSRERSPMLFRYRALQASQNVIDPHHSIVIVDEADNLLNLEPSFLSLAPVAEKDQLNSLLDTIRTFTIWITNRSEGIDESTLRRFDYSIRFDKFSYEQRRRIWKQNLAKHGQPGLLSADENDSLADRFEISAGGVDVAVRNACRMFANRPDRSEIMPYILNLLQSHVSIIDGGRPGVDQRKANAPDYALDGLNIHADMRIQLSIIEGFNRSWRSATDDAEVRNMNILLYGPPGTGKTEFVKYLSRHLKRRLIIRRSSDLLSMWVGQTEKLISSTFREAEIDGALLFIDEADSFLGNRNGATRSWEITQVNELLSCMESFRGMLICATNFRKVLDSAAIRRFNLKLEFDYLKSEGNVTFYNLFLDPLVNECADRAELARVAAMSCLTPGDFKVVRQKFLLAVDEGVKVTHGALIAALMDEQKGKNENGVKRMGF